MKDFIEICWIGEEGVSLKTGLQDLLGSSGQLLKKYFSSSALSRKLYFTEKLMIPLDVANHLRIYPDYDENKEWIKSDTDKSHAFVINETTDFLIVHKPPFLHCHPQRYSDKNTLLNFLCRESLLAPLKVNENQYDRGLLYRLDFETSGIIFLAKNEKIHQYLRDKFREQVKVKWYLAIVEGFFDKEGLWKHYLRPSGKKGGKQKVIPITDNKKSVPTMKFEVAELEVNRVAFSDKKSLVLVKLHTGLRHQIRAQLSFLGFPLLGDILYGGAPAERLFLHAYRYQIGEVTATDVHAELFSLFFDLNSAL